MDFTKTIEVEFKVQIPKTDLKKVTVKLTSLGFNLDHNALIHDSFLQITRSQVKGFDFTRLRRYDNGKIELTKKSWIRSGKDKLRSEETIHVDHGNLELIDFLLPPLFTVQKLRKHYLNSNVLDSGFFMTVCIDRLTTPNDDHLLLEAEILANESTFSSANELVHKLVSQIVGQTNPREADGFLKYCATLDPKIKQILDKIV